MNKEGCRKARLEMWEEGRRKPMLGVDGGFIQGTLQSNNLKGLSSELRPLLFVYRSETETSRQRSAKSANVRQNQMESGLVAAMVVLAVFISYVISSLIFFKYPHLLHKKKKLAFWPKHISHRGGKLVVKAQRYTSVSVTQHQVIEEFRTWLPAIDHFEFPVCWSVVVMDRPGPGETALALGINRLRM